MLDCSITKEYPVITPLVPTNGCLYHGGLHYLFIHYFSFSYSSQEALPSICVLTSTHKLNTCHFGVFRNLGLDFRKT